MNLRLLAAGAFVSLSLVGCATTHGGYAPVGSTSAYVDTGVVTRIEMRDSALPGATGAVVGGVVGAAAGRALTNDEKQSTQNLATAAGAVAGAMAGNAIQNRTAGTYVVHVRLADGRTVTVTQSDLGGIREGSQVRIQNGRAYLR